MSPEAMPGPRLAGEREGMGSEGGTAHCILHVPNMDAPDSTKAIKLLAIRPEQLDSGRAKTGLAAVLPIMASSLSFPLPLPLPIPLPPHEPMARIHRVTRHSPCCLSCSKKVMHF